MSDATRRLRLLIVAFHFPPIQGSTGTTRTLAFAKYLLECGWDIMVLTIRPAAYESIMPENESLIPPGVRVERAWGLDVRRDLSIAGRYPRLMALPDRWQSWIIGGYLKGRAAISRWRPDVIMSTYPIASAHVIGYLLHKKSGVPWVADFRDPMLQPSYPADPLTRRAFAAIEQRVFDHAACVLVTTEGCRDMYAARYAEAAERLRVISNGYDPEMFSEPLHPAVDTRAEGRLTLLHSGVLYPHERNPMAFFQAVRELADEGFFSDVPTHFRFRASGNEHEYRMMLRELGIESLISFLPRTDYRAAIAEMMSADALMVFQAASCNDQIPAKVYEYMYAGRPIVGLCDPQGDTGRLLKSMGVASIAALERKSEIKGALREFLMDLNRGTAVIVPRCRAQKFSRRELTRDLSDILVRTVGARNVAPRGTGD